MTSSFKDNRQIPIPVQPERAGIIQQWGGSRAFFFTYTHLSHDLTAGLLPALLPFIRRDLELNYLQTGFIVSAYALTSGLSQLLGGWVSDRIGRARGISLGLMGIGICSIAVGFVPNYFALLSVLIEMGIMAGFYHPGAISTLSTYFEAKQRGRVLALHMIGGNLGFGIAPLIAAVIASRLNWHLTYLILSVPPLLAAFLVFTRLKIPAQPRQIIETASPQGSGKTQIGVWQVFKPILGIIVLSVAIQLATGPIISFVSLFLVDVHHISLAAASMWVSMIRMGSLFGAVCGGWLSDIWGRRRTIYLTLGLFGVISLLISRLPFGVALAVAFIMIGLLMAMRETTMQAFLMDGTPPRLRATVIGIYFGFGQEGSSLIQPVAGKFMDLAGIAGVYNMISYISLGLSALVLAVAARSVLSGKLARSHTAPR